MRQQPLAVLLNQAHLGLLSCTRDRDLNPTFRANCRITERDHQEILRLALRGLLAYERRGPHGFGVGRLHLTERGLRELARLVPA